MQELINNRYRLLEELGQGGMATVYRAEDTTLDREVAVKLLDPALLERASTFLERFAREAKTTANMQHPYIINIHDYGEHEGQPFIVMPYLPGPSLDKLIKQEGALNPERVLRIAEQVGSALDYAHQRDVIHRDVKPANVLFDEHGQAILTDFGIVKLVDESTALTKTGTGLGTPYYMSPEQWKGRQVNAQSDLYALGIMIYEMLTGQVPFQGDTSASIMYGHLEGTPPSPQILNPSLPAQIEPVLLKALAKVPEQRYQTTSQLAKDLKEAIADRTSVSPPPTRTLRPTIPLWIWLSAIPMVFIIVGVGLFFLLFEGPDEENGTPITLNTTNTLEPTIIVTPSFTKTNTQNSATSSANATTPPLKPSPTPTKTPTKRLTPTKKLTPTPTLAIFATINDEISGSFEAGSQLEFCFWSNRTTKASATVKYSNESFSLDKFPDFLGTSKKCISETIDSTGDHTLEIVALNISDEVVTSKSFDFEVYEPIPRVFAAIYGGEKCSCSCTKRGAPVYDFGTQVDLCFWSNFTTTAKATVYFPDGQTVSLGSWDLNNDQQCIPDAPLPNHPKGLYRLEIIGDGAAPDSIDFCLDECRSC